MKKYRKSCPRVIRNLMKALKSCAEAVNKAVERCLLLYYIEKVSPRFTVQSLHPIHVQNLLPSATLAQFDCFFTSIMV